MAACRIIESWPWRLVRTARFGSEPTTVWRRPDCLVVVNAKSRTWLSQVTGLGLAGKER